MLKPVVSTFTAQAMIAPAAISISPSPIPRYVPGVAGLVIPAWLYPPRRARNRRPPRLRHRGLWMNRHTIVTPQCQALGRVRSGQGWGGRGREESGRFAEALDLTHHREPLEGLLLELAHARAADTEAPAGLLDGHWRDAAEAVAQLQQLALAVRQLAERPAQALLAQAHGHLFLGPGRFLAGHELPELRILAHRLLEARDGPRRLLHLVHLLHAELRGLRDLRVRRRPPELGVELPLRLADAALAVGDVHREADRARLVRDAALHRLPDPPRGVGGELEAAPPVELLDRADEPDDALLDQVQKRQAVALVALRDGDDQAEVRVDHLLLRFRVAALDPLRELHLLLPGEELVAADLVEEQLEAVGRDAGEVAVDVRGVGNALAAAVVLQLDAALLELGVDV